MDMIEREHGWLQAIGCSMTWTSEVDVTQCDSYKSRPVYCLISTQADT